MNRSVRPSIALAALAAAGLLAGCSNTTINMPATTSPNAAPATRTVTPAPSPTSGAPSPTSPAPSPVGGTTECTKAELAPVASKAAESLGSDNVYTVEHLKCAGGWAVTSGLLATKAQPNMGAPTSFVFRQEGQFWVLQDKAKVCGANPTTTTAPADAKIPAELFLPGCAAG